MIVAFDLDGTLVDSAPDIHATANALAAAEGLPPVDLATIKTFIGRGMPALIARLLAHHGAAGPEREARMIAAFSAAYTESVRLTRPYPGVSQALDALAAAGHVLAICTNKPEAPARAVLDHLGLLGRFAAVVGGDSLPLRKPDPAPLQLTRRLGGGGAMIFVGDSEVDAETATAAGVPFLLYEGGYRQVPVASLPHAASFADWAVVPGLVAARAA